MVHAITIPYDESILLAVSQRKSDFEREAPFLLAAKLYELGRISSGQAAKLCGMARTQFLLELPRIGVAISNITAEDIDQEVAFARIV